MTRRISIIIPLLVLLFACGNEPGEAAIEQGISQQNTLQGGREQEQGISQQGMSQQGSAQYDPDRVAFHEDKWRWIYIDAGIPSQLAQRVIASALEGPDFIIELLALMGQDPYLYILVDKENVLPIDYEPDDLVSLRAGSFRISRNDLSLRSMAIDALEEMARAAAADGITLTVGSSYRSGTYQAEVYQRWVNQLGQTEADRISARPGHSQHQLGLVVDFVPIDPSFADTPASRWLLENASRYGWSLSYPEGLEHITGYSYESWHYRYVGKDLAALIDNYFDGIQHYALKLIQAWMHQNQGY